MSLPPQNLGGSQRSFGANGEEILDAELVEVPWSFTEQSPFAPRPIPASAKPVAAAKRKAAPPVKRTFAPQRLVLLRGGVATFLVGYLTALGAVIFMAHGNQNFKEDAEFVHGFSLFVMLVGAVLVLGGYQRKRG